ncbi:MAG: aromatic ring-hydroxylating dioxygenase subunit alpha, partial [Myxococcales bacterium]
LNAPGYSTVRREFTVHATMHAAVENALDVPHTAFLHGGLFRTAKKENDVEVVVRRYGDRVEAEFVGEPRPKGLVGRLLAPGGGVVTHFDRFLLPNITQVEYRLGDDSHLVATSAMVPVRAFETRVVALVTFRLPIPSALVKPLLTPVAERIFHQDAVMLDLQTRSIERFGGEHYVSTELDVIGPHVLRLLRAAERGEPLGTELVQENRVRMRT